jgi:hypothetical protein
MLWNTAEAHDAADHPGTASQSQLEEVSDPPRLDAGLRDARKAGSAHSHLDMRVGEDVAEPVSRNPMRRSDYECSLHLLVLERCDPRLAGSTAPGGEQQHQTTVDSPEADGIQQSGRQFEQSKQSPRNGHFAPFTESVGTADGDRGLSHSRT